MEISWFDEAEHSSGAIGARLTTDAVAMRSLVGDALALLVQNIATVVAGLIIAFKSNWELALLILVLFPLMGISGYIRWKSLKDQFWSRVESDYNNLKAVFITELRVKRSLQCQMQTILTSVNKLRECVRQIENLHPNGASDQDIMNRAKALLMQDKKYNKGFKFDHVWSILKDISKFSNDTSPPQLSQRRRVYICSSQSDSPGTESPTSPNLASSN
ncbi:hypothetical protein Ddye_006937 [Dipteronia dyeriana]|uniref:ABC transmembrane type-1 domain-containing protein n=1 Tax=Dipteronia dyeriana TaxID=168575 RepID=A0AAD9XJ12_9ROSI|nr:hypothetical protein Ddye_006937 [Dipteronia dyeriana]